MIRLMRLKCLCRQSQIPGNVDVRGLMDDGTEFTLQLPAGAVDVKPGENWADCTIQVTVLGQRADRCSVTLPGHTLQYGNQVIVKYASLKKIK